MGGNMQRTRYLAVIACIAMVMAMADPSLAQESELLNLRLGMEPLPSEYFDQQKYWAAASSDDPGQTSTGETTGGEKKLDLEELSKQMDNPLGSLWILWMQNDTITIKGFPLKDEEVINATLIQPILPVPLTKDWLWVSRPVLSFISTPIPNLDTSGFGQFPGLFPEGPSFGGLLSNVQTDRKFEFGDMVYMGMLAPAELPDLGKGKLIWGLGPTWTFPTATHDFVGSGKYSVGPAGLLMYMDPEIKAGVIAQQWVSFAGESDRQDVSNANIQPLFYYSLPHLWQVGTSPNILVNWEAGSGNKWTVPLGGGVNKTMLLFDKLPVRFEVDVYYAAIHPDDVGQRWTFRFLMIPVVPNPLKLFGIDSIF